MNRILSLVLLISLGLIQSAVSEEKAEGYDLYHVVRLTIDLGPGIGRHSFAGVPITASLGNAALVIERNAKGGRRIVAMSLKSTEPIFYDGELIDLYMTINNSRYRISPSILMEPDFILNSEGTASVIRGKGYRMRIQIHADAIAVKAGEPALSRNIKWHSAMRAFDVAVSTGWERASPTRYPKSQLFPSGGLYPKKASGPSVLFLPASRR